MKEFGRPRTASSFRWVILSLLGSAMVINYMDRAALPIAMPMLTQDYHLSAGEKGIIFASFSVGYAAFNFVGGYLSDRVGPRRVFLWSMVFWSTICGLTALSFNFWTLLVARVLFGAGEGPVSVTANKTVNNWFPLAERARAIGLNQAGGPLGGAMAGPVVGFTAITFGWQAAFVVIAAFGLIWAAVWALLFRDRPEQHPRVSEAEVVLIAGEVRRDDLGTAGSGHGVSIREVLRNRSVLVMAVSLFCYNYILFFFLTWFPTYLTEAKGLSLRDMSVVTSLPWLIGAIGYMAGGLLIDTIYKRTGRQLFSRKVVLVSCLSVASVCIAGTGLADTATGAVTTMTVAIGFLMLTASAYWTLIQESVGPNEVGTASGVMHSAGNVSGIVGPALTGFIVQYAGSYTGAFVLAGTLGIAGALSVALLVRDRAAPRAVLVSRTV